MRDPSSRNVERPLRLPVLGESHASIHDLAHDAGYVKIKHSIGARMIYYFFQSRNSKDDPVCIWLNGGPGASAALAVLKENGPFDLTKHFSLVWNDYGWDKVCNIIYVDQPTGTGFSYSSSKKDIRRDEKGVSEDLYDFLQGIAIGNGLTKPGIQFLPVTDYALQNKLINQQDYNRINNMMVPGCEKASFDIRRQSCHVTFEVQEFLNKEDKMRNLEVGLPELLENGIKMLVYAGEYDLLCNWLGSYRWVKAMKWSGQPGFEAARVVKFMVDGQEAGELKKHGPLTFLKVHDAGHQVPMDQPKASLHMLKVWIDGKLK
ncbi:serine carboxypeptidase-like 49 [Bidens hawaiensis]|uniref:serine carboxypeptidase-like 49 n=1 Tax=Bidens hawaiensis TaxID=980011 RepID=UPI00404B1C37